MPQMAPMSWITMFMLFSLFIMMVMTSIYPSNSTLKLNKMKSPLCKTSKPTW